MGTAAPNPTVETALRDARRLLEEEAKSLDSSNEQSKKARAEELNDFALEVDDVLRRYRAGATQ